MFPKRVIIPFDFYRELFYSPFVNSDSHTYSEITKQIFDVMDPRLNVFIQNVEHLPKLDLIIVNENILILDNLTTFKAVVKNYALNIFFTCFQYHLFIDGGFDYILESIDQERCVLYYAR